MPDMKSALRGVTLRQLRTFACVAQLGSFSAAARALHVTQPAVSMQIRELEQACGVALYERIGRRIGLTEAGREIARCAAGIVAELHQAEQYLGEIAGLTRGSLRLGAVSTAKYIAPALLAAFRREYPAVTVQLTVGNREDMVRLLAANDSDLIVMGRPPAGIDTVASVFARHPQIIVAPPDHPLARQVRIPLAQLATESFLIREPGSGTRAAFEALCAAHGLDCEPSMEASSNETIKQAVMAGMGIAFISAHTVGLELHTERLVALDVVGLPAVRDWYVIHLAAKRLSPVAQRFREFVLTRAERIIEETVGVLPRSRERPRRRSAAGARDA